ASFNFEAKSSYSIRVRTVDQGGLSFEKPFLIAVTDVNEAPAAVALVNTTTSLAENTSTTSRTKVADIVVTDDALGSETITLSGTDAASFEVDGLALYLKSGVALNFEAKASYAVTVNVADTSLTGSTPVTAGFTLTVTDVNEAPAIFVTGGDSAPASLTETNAGLSATGTLSVADGDGVGTLAVSVAAVTASGATAGLTAGGAALLAMFSVNSSGLVGSISTSGTIAWTFASGAEAFDFIPDGETLVLTYLVRTVDAANLTAEQAVAITIRGTNDAPQVVAALLAYADTAADDAFATVTGTLAASDPDRGATRTFGIQGGTATLGVATRAGRFGTLSVKTATGEYAYRPDMRAINAVAADATDTFAITVNDGSATGTAAFVVSLTGTPDTPRVLSVSEDTGASTSDRLTNRNVITVMGSADPLTAVVVRDTVAGVTSVAGTATASAEGLFTVVTNALADGGHALEVVSESGGRSAGPVPLGEWRIDTVAPAAPAITTPDTSGGLVSGTAEPDSTVTVTVAPQGGFAGATYAVTAGADGTWAFDAASMPPVRGAAVPVPGGPFTFSATARDRAGNTSPASAAESIRFDTSAPRITSPSVTALLRPVIAGTAPARQTLRITIDGVVAGETTVSREGAWSFTVPADLAAGTRAVRVAVVAGGSERGVALQSLLVDRTPPAIPAITSAARAATSRPTISGTAPEGTTVALAIRRAGQTPVTAYTAPVGADGTWSVELGRMTPASGVLTTLADGDYDLAATAANAAGLVSNATTGRLSIDTTVPSRPGVGSSGTSASGTPVISGSAEPGGTVRLVIGEAVFETPVAADGTWSIDLGTATTLAGTRITLPDGIHELRLVAIDSSGNASPEAMQLLRVAAPVANEPPAVLASANSFSGVLTARDVAEGVTSVFALAGVADGTPATLEFADRTYTTAVADSAATFTIPQAELAALPQGTVAFTFSVGSAGISFFGSFVVDTVGPGRPTFGGITSTPDDKTPADQFTAVRRPTVVIRGEPGQTVVLRGPEGVVDPSRYSVVEAPAGTYTITLLDELATGDYSGMLADSSGNENPNRGGTPAQNFFRIDSVPILYDRPESRQAGEGRVYGVLGILNRLDGAEFPVAANTDGTWTDLDGERLTMGVVGG
ncbi:MAG: hypothetical protein EBS51_13860, partial [Planctomycetia bacterium]|nr:hypothetical protein [Planctomycetia bacterium]